MRSIVEFLVGICVLATLFVLVPFFFPPYAWISYGVGIIICFLFIAGQLAAINEQLITLNSRKEH